MLWQTLGRRGHFWWYRAVITHVKGRQLLGVWRVLLQTQYYALHLHLTSYLYSGSWCPYSTHHRLSSTLPRTADQAAGCIRHRMKLWRMYRTSRCLLICIRFQVDRYAGKLQLATKRTLLSWPNALTASVLEITFAFEICFCRATVNGHKLWQVPVSCHSPFDWHSIIFFLVPSLKK